MATKSSPPPPPTAQLKAQVLKGTCPFCRACGHPGDVAFEAIGSPNRGVGEPDRALRDVLAHIRKEPVGEPIYPANGAAAFTLAVRREASYSTRIRRQPDPRRAGDERLAVVDMDRYALSEP